MILTSVTVKGEQSMMPWDRWSWSMPQEPIEYFFRRQENLPIKSPSFKCECPPHNECVVEFKVDQDMADFLNIRGIIKRDELKKFREDLKKIVHSGGAYEGDKEKSEALRRKRRSGNPEQNCCCPPRNVYMPTFITERKFNDLSDQFKLRSEITENST